MDIYLFDKKIYDQRQWEDMTEEEAAHEFLCDMFGHVLWYTDMKEFETDFNNGCIHPGVFFVKIFN